MNTKGVSTLMKGVKATLTKYSTEVLTGVGIAGMITTTVLAVRATPKAMRLLDEKKRELDTDKLTVAETVKATWKCYIPPVVTGITSAACLVGASSVNFKRNAALATAYRLSETALTEYREKLPEIVGEKKAQSVRDEVAKDRVSKHPVENSTIIHTGNGKTTCLDYLTDRYFEADIDKIKKAENELNAQLLDEGSVCLNDFYYHLGIEEAGVGNILGWSYNRTGLVKLNYSSQLSNGTPVMVIDFQDAPYYEYDRY